MLLVTSLQADCDVGVRTWRSLFAFPRACFDLDLGCRYGKRGCGSARRLDDIAFVIMTGNFILRETRPPIGFCQPITAILWLAHCKLPTQRSPRAKLHDIFHELHSCPVKPIYANIITTLRQRVLPNRVAKREQAYSPILLTS